MDVRSRCVPYPMQRHLLFRHPDACIATAKHALSSVSYTK